MPSIVERYQTMTREELREKIRAAALHFTEEVSAIFAEAFVAVAAEFKSNRPTAQASPEPSIPAPAAPTPPPVQGPRPVGRPRGRPVGSTNARPGRPAGSPNKPISEADRRNRRSTNELDRTGDDILRLLTTTRTSMRVEEINRRLGTNTKQLMRPIQKLLSGGQIRKDGERRATVYFV
jgi:hypothetical protein